MAVLELGERCVDLERLEVSWPGGEETLTVQEAELLRYLAAADGRVVPRDELLREVWAYREGVVSRAVDHAVRRLRLKIEPAPKTPVHIVSVYGGGYRLDGVRRPDPGFVGRRRELLGLRRAVAGGRFVSVVGPGGVGKTTLLRQLLAQASGDTLFVPLRDARTAAAVVRAVADGLGLPSELGEGRVARALGARGALVLGLDNLEQVAEEAGPVVAGWVRRVPELTVVVTTREALGAADEKVIELAPMEDGEAGELFRTRAGEDGCEGWSEGAIRELVQRLDGLPLAIELAAARADVVEPDRMLRMLDGAPALVGGRGRTVESALRWSWDLLTPPEQAAVAQASVFAGTFDAAAADAVLDLGEGAPMTVDVLAALRRKSLLTLSARRFGMLQTVAGFARQRLAEADAEAVARRHAEHYRAVAEAGAGAAEAANAMAAWAWAAAAAWPEGAYRLARAMDPWLLARRSTARRVEVWERTVAAVEEAGAGDGGLALGAARRLLADAARARGQLDRAGELLEAARPLVADGPEEAGWWLTHGVLTLAEARIGDAATALARGVELARRHGCPREEWGGLANLGHARWMAGDLDAAARTYRDALAVAQRQGSVRFEVVSESYLGNLLMEMGDVAAARERFEAVLAGSETVDAAVAMAASANLGVLDLEAGDFDAAEARFAWTADLARRLADRAQEGVAVGNLGILRLLQGRDAEAADLLARGADGCRASSDPRPGAYLAAFRGDFDAARAALDGLGDRVGALVVAVLAGEPTDPDELAALAARSSDLRLARAVAAARA